MLQADQQVPNKVPGGDGTDKAEVVIVAKELTGVRTTKILTHGVRVVWALGLQEEWNAGNDGYKALDHCDYVNIEIQALFAIKSGVVLLEGNFANYWAHKEEGIVENEGV